MKVNGKMEKKRQDKAGFIGGMVCRLNERKYSRYYNYFISTPDTKRFPYENFTKNSR